MTPETIAETMTHRAVDAHFIDGTWSPAQVAERIDVHDSNTGAVIGHAPAGTAAEVERAVAAAKAAQPAWAALPAAERARYLRAVAAGLEARQEELAQIIAREVGAPIALCRGSQTQAPVFNFTNAARIAEEYAYDERLGNAIVTREPIGVVAAITAWNFPLHLVTVKAAFALAAGNTVVVKPSEVAPLSAAILGEIAVEAGLPAGVLNVVFGTGPEVGEALVAHEDVRMVTFTGSTRAGRRIGELAADQVKKVTLELGGKSPLVILDGADLPAAVSFGIDDLLINNGQRCDALTRMVVPRHAVPEVERLVRERMERLQVGLSWDERTDVGPMVSAVQRDRVMEYLRIGREEGARVVVGGPDAAAGPEGGYFVPPTVFSDVDPGMRIAQEEIFGPVLVIQPYDDAAEAVEIANDTVYGLHAAVWAGDNAAALAVGRKIEAGVVTVNDGVMNMDAPFGGYKQSGLGREYGVLGFEEFLEIKKLELPA